MYSKPKIIKTYSEAQLLSEQTDLVAEGWGLWSNSGSAVKDLAGC